MSTDVKSPEDSGSESNDLLSAAVSRITDAVADTIYADPHQVLGEYDGDIRDPKAGCWHVTDQMHNSTSFGPNHCRKPCLVGSRYCEDHQDR